jgi:HSP20 family molecular chaperone IbpA
MKRMYVILGIMFLLLLAVLSTCLAQFQSSPPPSRPNVEPLDHLKRSMELREEMHRRMRDKILRGIGPDQDMFKDMEKLLEETMSESHSGFDSIVPAANFSMEWLRSNGGRTLVVTPKNPQQQLDIDVKTHMITIKGKVENKSAGNSFVSSFSNTFSVPEDCDGDRVKIDQRDGKILVELPFRSVKQINVPKKEERKPLPPSGEEVTI